MAASTTEALLLELIIELRAQLTLLHGQNAELRTELHAARNERAMRAAHADENGQTPFLPSLDELEQMAQDQGNAKLAALLKNLGAGTEG
jgi:hypothetical protein